MSTFEFGPVQKLWLKNLKEHPERKRCTSLGRRYPNGQYTACALGELLICLYRVKKKRIPFLGLDLADRGKETSYSFLINSFDKVGLRDYSGKSERNASMSIVKLNDFLFKSWPEIAAIVEADPEAYFTKSV